MHLRDTLDATMHQMTARKGWIIMIIVIT